MRGASRSASALLALLCAGALAHGAVAATSPNYQGLWWASPPESESGWGLNLSHQGDRLFAAWFTYDASGTARWLTMTADRRADGSYAGTLYETRGPAFDAMPFDSAKVKRTAVGEGTLVFRDIDTGTFSYTVGAVAQTKFLTRQAFDALPTCTYAANANVAAASNYQDMWWVANGAESGWGLSLTHQGDRIFAAWFTYDHDGTPMWLSATAQRTGAAQFAGPLQRTTGPAFDAVPFDPAKVARSTVGSLVLSFANGNAGTFDYVVDGVAGSKAITRQLFAPPAGTVCGAPVRALTTTSAVAAGDIGQCFGAPAAGSAAARTAALITAQDSLVLTVGDNTYDYGTPEEFANCFDPTWGVFKDRIRPTIGNHEYYSTGAEGYFGYFGARAGPDRLGYYSFDVGGWHVISLNAVADNSPQSPQWAWLESDLARSKDALCTLALLHYPAFNSGVQYGSVMAMRPLFGLLQGAGVDVVLAGHDHLYERFAPQRADGTLDLARGLRQFTVGTGGHGLNPFGNVLPNSEFRFNADYAVLRLTLAQGRYGWQLVTTTGRVVDAGSASCHP